MNRLISLFVLYLLIGCSSTKNSGINNPEIVKHYNVQVKILRYIPYCGGAAPSEEMMNNYQPGINDFVLINNSTKEKSTFRTDSLGMYQLNLDNGEYIIREIFKDLTYEEFYAKNSITKGQYYKNTTDTDCYRKWWEQNLFEFEITDTTTIIQLTSTLKSACFTGNNPCIMYNGPWPP